MKLSLVVLTPGKQQAKTLPITLSQFVIGRDPQCHLRPASVAVSKRHCALLVRNGKVFVRDFDSTNGTFVNDQPIKGEVELHHEDQLKVGSLLFSVLIEPTSPPVNRPTPPPPTKAPLTAEAPANASEQTPEPSRAAAKASASGEGSDDDSVAAMLLSLQDDSDSISGGGEVPEGSTVVEFN